MYCAKHYGEQILTIFEKKFLRQLVGPKRDRNTGEF